MTASIKQLKDKEGNLIYPATSSRAIYYGDTTFDERLSGWEDAEVDRKTSEVERKTKETERLSAESNRVSAEVLRNTKESERLAAEELRIAAENERQVDTAKAIEDCEVATEEVREATTGLTDRVNSIGNLKWMNGNMVEDIPFDKNKHIFWNEALSIAWDSFRAHPNYSSFGILYIYSKELRKDIFRVVKYGNQTQIHTSNGSEYYDYYKTTFDYDDISSLQTRHNIACLDFVKGEVGGFTNGEFSSNGYVKSEKTETLKTHRELLNQMLESGVMDEATISIGRNIVDYKSFISLYGFRMTDKIANDLCKRGLYFTEQVPLYRRGDYASSTNVLTKYTSGWRLSESGGIEYSQDCITVERLTSHHNFYVVRDGGWSYMENKRRNTYSCKLTVLSGSMKPRGFLINGRAEIVVTNEAGEDLTDEFLTAGIYYLNCFDYISDNGNSNDHYVFNTVIAEGGCRFSISEFYVKPMTTFLQCVVKDVANNYINVNNEDYYPFLGDATPNDMIKPALYGTGTPSIKADFISQLYVNTEDGSAYVAKDIMSNVWKKITQ